MFVATGGARTVYQHIEIRELGSEPLRRNWIREVDGMISELREIVLVEFRLTSGSCNVDVCAGLSEPIRNRKADALRSPGYENSLCAKVECDCWGQSILCERSISSRRRTSMRVQLLSAARCGQRRILNKADRGKV